MPRCMQESIISQLDFNIPYLYRTSWISAYSLNSLHKLVPPETLFISIFYEVEMYALSLKTYDDCYFYAEESRFKNTTIK